MSKRSVLPAQTRTITGRKVKQLRRQAKLPANVFGQGIESQALTLDHKEFAKIFAQSGETALIDLAIDSVAKTRPVLIKNIHSHPVTGEYLHVDLHQVNLTEKVTAMIPVVLSGVALAVKDQGGVLNQAFNELEVVALPTDLPENITINLETLSHIGDSISLSQLKHGGKFEFTQDPETLVVSIIEAKVQEEPEPETAPEAEAETAPAEEGSQPKPAPETSAAETPAE
jgi:large subunit ribosomal protein L25